MKTADIHLRVSLEQKADIAGKAALAGIGLTKYLLDSAATGKVVIVPHVNEEQWAELSGACANLRAAMGKINQCKDRIPPELWRQLHDTIVETNNTVTGIRGSLLNQ